MTLICTQREPLGGGNRGRPSAQPNDLGRLSLAWWPVTRYEGTGRQIDPDQKSPCYFHPVVNKTRYEKGQR